MKEESKKKTNTSRKTTNTKKDGAKKITSKKTTVKKTTVKKPTVKKEEISKEKVVESIAKEEQLVKPTVKLEKDEFITPSIHVMGIIAILLAAMLVIIYGMILFKKARNVTYSEAWVDKSYLVEEEIAPQVSCEGLSNAILGNRAFVFVTSYSEEEFELEKKLAKVIKENKLGSDFYVYSLADNCGPISEPSSIVGKYLKLKEGIQKIPTILFYRNGMLEEIVTREDEKMLEVGDFQKLLDIYEITK